MKSLAVDALGHGFNLEDIVIAAPEGREVLIGTDVATLTKVLRAVSKPLVMAFRPWLEQQLARVSGKSGLAEDLRYGLNHWEGLIRFLDDGRIELDTNSVERAIRPLALGRRAWLFAGSDRGAERAAVMLTLIMTARLNEVDPKAWLADVFRRIAEIRSLACTNCFRGSGKQTTPQPLRPLKPLTHHSRRETPRDSSYASLTSPGS
jgi:Transposase IS66 family/IS66 C-terminal element